MVATCNDSMVERDQEQGGKRAVMLVVMAPLGTAQHGTARHSSRAAGLGRMVAVRTKASGVSRMTEMLVLVTITWLQS